MVEEALLGRLLDLSLLIIGDLLDEYAHDSIITANFHGLWSESLNRRDFLIL